MNILINFSNQKKGGGHNVALNFLNTIYGSLLSEDMHNSFFYIVAKDSGIHRFLIEKEVHNHNIYIVPSNPVKRILFELLYSNRIIKDNKIDIIYSYFGYGLFNKKTPQVIGCALSNLFYPNIDFWIHYNGLAKIKKRLIDRFRLYGIKRADGIIFETELLERKCHELYMVQGVTTTIKPSIFTISGNKTFSLPKRYKSILKGMFLCGWQLNKNIMLIPEIASYLKKDKFPFLFIITAPLDNSSTHKSFVDKIKKYNVEDYIYLSNSVPKEQLKSLYEQIDFVFLLSKLESFSNNIIEAYSFNKALIVADEEWSRWICKDSAIYVDRDNPFEIAKTIKQYSENKDLYNFIIKNGLKMLKTYPSIETKTIQELDFIKKVYEKSN